MLCFIYIYYSVQF